MFRRARLATTALILATVLGSGSGCFRGGGQLALAALDVAAVVAEVALVAAVLSHHDDHYHVYDCHPTRYYEGNELYYYNGNWEYYDNDSQLWYVYR